MQTKKIKAIIIDDEPGCVSYLKYCLANYCPDIEVIATGFSSNDFLHYAKVPEFDVAFLDIRLFDVNIFDIIQHADHSCYEIVFVTAFDSYALQAYRANALDYILKPIRRDDIINGCKKLKKHLRPDIGPLVSVQPDSSRSRILRMGEQVFVVQPEDILYLKAKGPYTEITFYTNDRVQAVTISKTLRSLEQEYKERFFYRVHKSFLINLNRVARIVKGDVYTILMQDGSTIGVAKRRAGAFIHDLNTGS